MTATSTSKYATVNSAIQASDSFVLTLEGGCSADTISLVDPGQADPAPNNYDGTDIVFTLDPFTVSPAPCASLFPITYSCAGVTTPAGATASVDCQELDGSNQLTWSFGETEYTTGYAPGTYTFTYNVEAGDAAETFTVDLTLVDPCDPPTTTQPDADTFSYTITDPGGASLTLDPLFTVDPSYCLVSIAVTEPTTNGIDTYLSFDSAAQTISLAAITTDIDIAGDPSTDYSIPAVLTYQDYDGNESTISVTQTLTVVNPCTDPSYVSISGPTTLPTLEYPLGTGAVTFAAHDAFTLTDPNPSSPICGPLELVGKYDGVEVTSTGELTYDETTRQFTVEIADDPSRYDTTEEYSVCARLEEYPSTVTVEAEGTISLLAACVTPNSLVASTPVNPSANDFDGATVTANLAEFTVDPAFCGVSYSCTGVARQDGAATAVDCNSFTLDLDFGGGGDGSISISADSTVYLAQTSITPGVYEVSISGSVVGAAPAVEHTALSRHLDVELLGNGEARRLGVIALHLRAVAAEADGDLLRVRSCAA